VRSLIDPNLVSAEKKAVKGAHLSLVESLTYSPDGKYWPAGAIRKWVVDAAPANCASA